MSRCSAAPEIRGGRGTWRWQLLGRGNHWGRLAPLFVFWARMLLGDFFVSKDALGQGRKPGNAPSDAELLYFPDSSGQKKFLKDGGGAVPQDLGCLTSLCIRHWSVGTSRAFHPTKKPLWGAPSTDLGGSQPKACYYFSPWSWPLFRPLFYFFFPSFPFKSKPGKASDVGTAAASSSWLLGEGGGGDIPDHKTRILL